MWPLSRLWRRLVSDDSLPEWRLGGWADVAMCDAGQVFRAGDAFGDDTTFGKGCHFQPETVFGDKVASSQLPF